jgi:5-methyltetrahydrofolate--homocysteine methyltransferase
MSNWYNNQKKGDYIMIIIGERINSTRKQVKESIESRNRQVIVELVQTQESVGSSYLDINGGHPTQEADVVKWFMEIAQETCDLPLSLDSANPEVIGKAFSWVKKKPIVNSISLEKDRIEKFLPIVRDHECSVIALLMSDDGVPTSNKDREQRAEALVGKLLDIGKKPDEIFVDPCFLAIYTEENAGLDVLESVRWIRNRWPGIHISGGVSNASYGLPKRKWINQAYLVLAIGAGLDAAIIDPCVEGTVPLILAAEVIVKKDEMAANYMDAARAEKV